MPRINKELNSDPKISIALCTYNGERYLKEQLDSFLRQKLLPYEIVACDDASTDSTVEILEDFARTAPFPIRIYRSEHNLGLIQNFSKAASLCTGDYVAFSDQDDIWLPDRLNASFHRMKEAEREYGSDIPLLVYSDLSLIDSEGRCIRPSFMKYQKMWHSDHGLLRILLAQNTIAGNTSLCNKVLMQVSLPFPEVITNHDGWFALVAASIGKIFFIPEALVLYRQHESNAVGAGPTQKVNIRYIRYILNHIIEEFSLTSITMMEINKYLYQAKELQKRLNERSRKAPSILNIYIEALEQGGLMAARILIINKIRPFGFIKAFLFYYWIARSGA
jgi:glycosyltransferase involved in cell wall biosynthesis